MRENFENLLSLLLIVFVLAESPESFAQDENPSLLDQQVRNLFEEGKYQQAIPIAEKLLAIREKELGLEHLDTASSLNSLATLYLQIGDYAKAEPLLLQLLQVVTKILGPEDAKVAITLNRLGLLYDHMGTYTKAEPFFQRALEIWNKLPAPESFNSVAALSN